MKRKTREPAMLPCIACKTWTDHSFAHTEPGQFAGTEHSEVYRCGACHRHRVWGTVRPSYAVKP